MIEGVEIKKLKVHEDERGSLFEILRSDEPMFMKFGQVYISKCKPGWVKGWHYHKKQCDYFCVIKGKARVVLFDNRHDSKTFGEIGEYEMGEDNLMVLKVPPFVVHGFECLGEEDCWLLNVPDQVYNREKPDEYRISLNDPSIPYERWKVRKGW